ncbi:MAG TPA: nucleoside monophosphate kinase [Acidimicrobiales bacterium]|nr:nucleoside monophosphate kinase [Acidimicrobiales bacterium]
MASDPSVRLVILGKQGAGKGTQCGRLARQYEVPHISTGEMFRAAEKSGSEFGRELASYMHAGDLIPDELVVGAMAERLSRDGMVDCGFILDGFPRTANQAEALAKLLDPLEIDMAVDLQVPTEVVLRRLATRRMCRECGLNYSVGVPPATDWTCDVCGGEVIERTDDTAAAIERRLKLYEMETEPLVLWYLTRDKLITVDGVGDPDVVTRRLIGAIDRRLRRSAGEGFHK